MPANDRIYVTYDGFQVNALCASGDESDGVLEFVQ